MILIERENWKLIKCIITYSYSLSIIFSAGSFNMRQEFIQEIKTYNRIPSIWFLLKIPENHFL